MATDLSPTSTLEAEHIKILYYEFERQLKTNYSSKNYIRFCSILEGSKFVSINKEKKFHYDQNSFIILSPFSAVELEINEKTKAFVMEIDDYFIRQIISKLQVELEEEEIKYIENEFFIAHFNPDLCEVHKKIVNIFNQNRLNKEFLLDLYSQELVYNILKYKGSEKIINNKKSKISAIIEFIESNYLGDLKISDIANYFGMREYEFSRYFKKFTGKSPKEYIKDLKLKKAKELLAFQNVTEVSFDVGYENISYFIKEFREKYGITPKEYKKII
jgi:AraC-like DNA-binding protein